MLTPKQIRSRQIKGIAAAKRKGKYHGKPTTLTPQNKKIRLAFRAYFIRSFYIHPLSMADIAHMVGISRQTLYRKVKQYKPRAKDYLNKKEYHQWIISHDPNGKMAKQLLQRRDHQTLLKWKADKYHAYGVEPPWKSQN